MLPILLAACAAAPAGAPAAPAPPPTGTIPEVASAGEPPLPRTALAAALAEIPAEVSGRYVLRETPDGALDVREAGPVRDQPRREVGARGISVGEDGAGGKLLSFDGGRPTKAEWVTDPLAGRLPGGLPGHDLTSPRPLLVVTSGEDVVTLAFGRGAEPAEVIAICHDVTVVALDGAFVPRPVRKPVIYLYPEAPTRVRVDVALATGDFTARWPAPGPDGWEVLATPTGRLVDPATGRSHRYLFWEAESEGFSVDPARARLVAAADASAFLQEVCDATPLTDDECGDFLTYWLPELARAPWSLVEVVGDTYPRYARLSVTPEPDTTIRLFLAIRPLDRPVAAASPPLPRHRREGFVVVEWGGTVVAP